MASDSDLEQRVSFLLKTLEEQAETAVRNPRSTVEPTREVRTGRRALEVLQGLTHDDRALVDEGELGRGGMGIVKLARQVSLDRRVAVKTLRNGQAEQDVEALLSEAWLAGSLEHPGILPIHALSLDADGLPVVVMKRIEGVTWSKLLSGEADLSLYAPGRNRLESHLRIAMQLCNAVHFANSRGIVHRDLKPDNVMLGRFGEVYLVDWGIATTAGASSQFAGTPAYMAPEMFGGGSAELSAATDVYLLGSILCEVVSGRPPHLRGTTQEMFQSVLRSEPELPSALPTELNQLIRRCMGRVPSTRYATALEVRGALEAFLEHQGSRELEQQAESRASELLTLLKGTADPLRVSRLFSECRFGFQQSLRVWPENAHAKAALARITAEMVRFELKQGSVRSAQALLSELMEPPADVVAALAQAEAAEAEKAREVERLHQFALSVDPLTGSRVRMLLATALGSLWAISPLLMGRYHVAFPEQDETLLSLPACLASLVLMIIVAIRTPPGRRTQLNVQIANVIRFGMGLQLSTLIVFSVFLGGLGERTMLILHFYWFVLTGVVASGLVREIWPAPVCFLLTLFLALRWPGWRYEFAALGCAGLLVTMLVVFLRQTKALADRETKTSVTGPGAGG
jgi:serine/threonine-protein kinase